jgi:Cysteine rich repeat
MARTSILALGVALLLVAGTTATAQPSPRPCAADIKAFCTNIQPGEGRIAACIKEHIGDFSLACKARLITAITTTRACAADVKGQCTRTGHTSEEVTACLREVLPKLGNLCKTAILAAAFRAR